MTNAVDLAGLLAIWPIAESFASQTSVGDLITLGRTSPTLRSSLHGRIPDDERPRRLSTSRGETPLNPAIGKHQTTDWIYLKSIALFNCYSVTHTRGKVSRPCVYCSKPICDACIVRDSFKHRNENTFKNRLRYFCQDCWSEGRPTRRFRFPATAVANDEVDASISNSAQLDEKPYFEAYEFCECKLKDNGWLCLGCKEEQNSSSASPSKLSRYADSKVSTVQCYGLDCTNMIDLDSPDKDRRRVCLWCQKPHRRQWSGEDRFAWKLKTIEARARIAESRTKDLEEYNRRHLQMMRMSRKEMRGTSDDESPVFVRHLDVVNYRNWMPQRDVPDPGDVWKSKNGYWRYHAPFLYKVQTRCMRVNFVQISGVAVKDLSEMTREGTVAQARLNRDMYPDRIFGVTSIPTYKHIHRNEMCLHELKARIFEMLTEQNLDFTQITEVLIEQYGLEINVMQVESQMRKWQEKRDSQAGLDQTSSRQRSNSETTTLVAGGRESETSLEVPKLKNSSIDDADTMASSSSLQDEVDQMEVDTVVGNDAAVASSPATVAAEEQQSSDPPPYAL